MKPPRAIIGAPVFSHEGEFREALESILSQSFRDFRLVIVDDCSTDATEWIARQYAAADPRVEYLRNDTRLGMIANWRRAFDVGTTRWPEAEYFAWASDHDIWHPRWLASLVDALDANPNVVLAYPLHHRIGPNSEFTDTRLWKFDTRGVTQRVRRFNLAMWNMSAGNMVYGLARAAEIRACGVFRHVLVPDRLLIMELSLRGEFYQVHEILWYRRFYGRLFSLDRQRTSFFPQGRPLYAYVPWWISHAAVLSWVHGVRRKDDVGLTRGQGLLLGVSYFWLAGMLHFKQQIRAGYVMLRQKVRLTTKNVVSTRRRQRVLQMAARETRRSARHAVAFVLRGGAWGVRSVPMIGPAIMNRLRPEAPQVKTGALDLLHLQRTVARLRRTVRPIIVGPFLAEPEYELLYWIPFLRWLQKEAVIDPDLIVAVSRGGVESWYEGICSRYVEVLNLVTLAEVQTRTESRWIEEASERKLAPVTIETNITRRVARLGALRKPHIVHRSEMQRLFRHVWSGAASPDLIERHSVHQRLRPPALPSTLQLPSEYVAVRFAFGASFPDTPENRQAARTVIEARAATDHVVLLNTGVSLDGLQEFDPGPLPNVSRIDEGATPASGLGLQTAVIGRASRYVGTLDSLACLAAMCGVPAQAVYSETPGATSALIDALRRTATALRTDVAIVNVRDLDASASGAAGGSRVEAMVSGSK